MWAKTSAITVGISISPSRVEGLVYDVNRQKVSSSFGYDLPQEIFTGGQLIDESYLRQTVVNLAKHLGLNKHRKVHVALAADLFRMMEMPKLDAGQMHVALSSEAERFRAFEGAEAVVDYFGLDVAVDAKKMALLAMGVRRDTFDQVVKLLQFAKLQVLSVSVAPLENLRGFAGAGWLAGVTQQLGENACWGCLLAEYDYVRLIVCQGSKLTTVREIQIDLTSASQESMFLIEDLLDEIQRTIRQSSPLVWFAAGLPANITALLQNRLQVPIRPFDVPAALLPEGDKINIATLGAALSAYVVFPGESNLLTAGKPVKRAAVIKPKAMPMPQLSSGLLAHPTTKLAAVMGGLCIAVWGVFTVLGVITDQAVGEMNQKKTLLTTQITEKQQELNALKARSSVQAALLDTVERIRARNTVYQKFGRELRMKVPPSVWLYHIAMGTDITIEGKALEHQSVIQLARSFDDMHYLTNVDFDYLKEVLVGKRPVYEFKIKAGVQSNDTLLQDNLLKPVTPPVAAATSTAATPVASTVAAKG
jgi:Tfp pilus assembly protein PilN